ncbi:putative linocin/CFP29 family protein [Aminivibrio pyruvatiphilus]|uniref:Putative linocin/CFP29 family protein n=1 Tax=Aminivibrio pyruvatiphilus TaxID=1005740 RepID=A0A4R8LY29_9BACT|nr:family 1 encapsulin nanocompartment shell protein [Aminivibrio pyruvatiphilus]TDY53158.1 putative linocin/CFP29 family protein [Aminivibrio pyruvatiphilus]
MDILRRAASLITPEAWAELDRQAKKVLTANLSARKFVDVEGPKGWSYSAHPTGRLDVAQKQPKDGVQIGVNRVLPLVEARHTFDMDIWELDNISRGAKDPDLSTLEKAAKEIALFEEKAVYKGLASAGIEGLAAAAKGRSVKLGGDDAEKIVDALSAAIYRLHEDAVEGPYALAASPKLWKAIYGAASCYPISKHVGNLVDKVILSTQDESYVVSLRGGDFELVLGQDLSLGFEERNGGKVRLFFTESFTFRVITPEAVVALS